MKRLVRIARILIGLVIGLPLLALLGLVVVGNTGEGRRLLARTVSDLSGGMVTVVGLSGRFPDALRAGHIVVRDVDGAWMTIDQARVDWSPLRLVGGEIRIETLAAMHVAVSRWPKNRAASDSGTSLPLSVAVGAFRIDRLDLAVPVAGAPASLSLTGDLALASSQQGRITLAGRRLDGEGSYTLSSSFGGDGLAARIAISEPAHGLVLGLADLDDLGAVSVSASLEGPSEAEELRFQIAAGPLAAEGHGKIDLIGKALDLGLTASAPQMTLRPDLAWQSARLDARFHGPFTGPAATGHLEIEELRAGGGSAQRIAADMEGANGAVGLTASAAGLQLPGLAGLFAAAPVELRVRAALNAARRPVTFTLSHPLLTASGEIITAGAPAGSLTVGVPSLAPYAKIAGIDIEGRADMTVSLAQRDDGTHIGGDGTIGVTGGLPVAAALIADNARVSLSGSLHDGDVTLDNLALDGRALRVSAKGRKAAEAIDLDWTAALSDLSVLSAMAAGTLSAQGHLNGALRNFATTARLTGEAAIAGLPKDSFTVALAVHGLPGAPSGTIEAGGHFAGAPIQLDAAARQESDGTLTLSLDRVHWKSVSGDGRFALAPGSGVPLGHLHLRIAELADLAPLTGAAARGAIDVSLDAGQPQGRPDIRLRASAQQLAVSAGAADRLTLDAHLTDPATHPVLTATAAADGIRAGAVTGNARVTASGPLDLLALRLTSDLRVQQSPATLSAAATARLPRRDLQVSSLDARYQGETLRLLAPARLDFGNGLAVDRLRLGIGGATVALNGRLTPALALAVAVRDVTPAIAKLVLPDLRGTGTIALNGELRGTLAAPEGTLRLTARDLRVTTARIGGLPGTDIEATTTLRGDAAYLNARFSAGTGLRLTLAGTAPLRPSVPLALRLAGTVDLAMLDPLLAPGGRAARGQAAIDVALGGTIAAPRPSGTVRLAKGDVRDFVQGIHITDLNGLFRADGGTIRLEQLTGRAGSGTLSATGTIGVLQPNLPTSLTVTAHRAQFLASDLLSATTDADLTVRGDLLGNLTASGKIHVANANINIPNRLPQSVAVLNVRRPGAKPPTWAASASSIALGLTIDAPEQVFVRGHGVDAEMGGTLKIGGTAKAPVIDGGFELRHGTFSLVGQTLTFTSGKVAFGGTGLAGKLDPTLNFVAQTMVNNVTATLTVTGYADAPKIQLSSSPELPQDEILGRLLFGQSTQQLSPFQLAEVAQAAASFSGVGGGDPLGAIRGGLGLDRLSVSSASGTNAGATVEAGKYVAKGVYVGARQGSSGGSQAQVQIDLTKHLKVQTRLGTGGTPVTGITPENDPGSSIGLTYGFDY